MVGRIKHMKKNRWMVGWMAKKIWIVRWEKMKNRWMVGWI